MKYLGIDYGSKKIGLALSDEAGTMGFPRGIVASGPKAVEEIGGLIEREGVEAIVIGESRDLAGNDNPIAEDARRFAALLTERAKRPVYWEAEFFTSAAARRGPGQPDAKPSRAPRTREAVDASAAALILTNYLTRIHGR